MFFIMLGFTFFSASMWTGVDLANGLNLRGFVAVILLGGAILAAYTGALGYIGAKTGLSFDLLARRAFGAKGSRLPSAMIALTQIGWFGVGAAMFAIPAAQVLAPESRVLPYLLVLAVGVCMTTSAYFGIKGLEIVSYVSVPLIAILGHLRHGDRHGAGRRPDGDFCQIHRRADALLRRGAGHRLLRQRRRGHAELHPLRPRQ